MSTNLGQEGAAVRSARGSNYVPLAKRLSGKVAIVTGASKGIGAAIAKQLAAEGAAVVVNYASSKTAAERVVGDIESDGGKALAVRANIAKKTDIERLFAETKKAFDRLDILVNNAGIYEFLPLEAVTEEHFHKHFDLNVLGLILASKEAAAYFDSAGGSIINISSVASTHTPANASVYGGADALRSHEHVCVETTGASAEILDDLLALEEPSKRLVVRVRVPLEACLQRIAARDQTNQIPMDVESIRKVHALSEALELQPAITIENVQLTDAQIAALFKDALHSLTDRNR
jgi:short-subunit dehydrogenase